MNFSQGSAAHFVPILARIALCVIFIPAGWGKIMGERTFSGPEISVLQEIGAASKTEADAQPAEIKMRPLYEDAILIKEHDLPYPVIGAWLVALTELLGGGLVLIGLFTRIMSMGFATIMGFGFALVSLPAMESSGGVFNLAEPIFYQAAAQIAIAALALGLLFSGAGSLSVDAAIFSHGRSVSRRDYADEFDADEEDYDE